MKIKTSNNSGIMERFYSGRINSKQFAKGFVVLLGTAIVLGFVEGVIVELLGIDASMVELRVLEFIVAVPLVLLLVSITIRRLHDLSRSGWFAVLLFIPVINVIFSIYLIFKNGVVDPNEFGSTYVNKSFKETLFN